MTKYHINDHGQIEVCEEKDSCRYGIGSENHYFTEYDAKAAQMKWQSNHSALGSKQAGNIQMGMAAYAAGGGMGSAH